MKKEPTAEVKLESAAPAEAHSDLKAEETGDGDQQMYAEEEDDEIDFNLGNGGGYDSSTNHNESSAPGIKEDG